MCIGTSGDFDLLALKARFGALIYIFVHNGPNKLSTDWVSGTRV